MLAEITFALMHYQQQPTLFIGGLQGANHEVPHAEIQHTTKEVTVCSLNGWCWKAFARWRGISASARL